MKRIVSFLLVICAVALAITYTAVVNTRTKAAGPQSQRRVVVESRNAPGIAVNLSAAIATQTDGQTALKYTVSNHTGGRLTAFGMLALVISKNGEVKGGEGWTVRDALGANSTEEFLRIMKTDVGAEEHLVLTMWKVSGDSGAYEVDKTLLNNVLKPRASVMKQTPDLRSIKIALPDDAAYCRGWHEYAKSQCACGVKSFNCNPKDGSFGWTCFTRAESPSCVEPPPESE